MDKHHFTKLGQLISESEKGVLKQIDGLTGYSGEKLVGALQRIAQYQEHLNQGAYLEVGVFQGLTLLSVAGALSKSRAFGVDNFAQFDQDGRNRRLINERINLNRLRNVLLIECDYEDALEALGNHIGDTKIGLYFVDGPHDYRSQLMCLLLATPFLSESAVIVVDDCNYPWVRLANRDFLIRNPSFKLIFEAYTECHPGNMSEQKVALARKGWWNGVNMIAYDPTGILEPIYPPTQRSRELYENEHLVLAASRPNLAPEATLFFSHLLDGRFVNAARTLAHLWRKSRDQKGELAGRYPAMNTDSRDLPCRLNGALLSTEAGAN